MKNIRIRDTGIRFYKEPLAAPFGFKGSYLTDLWQTSAFVSTENGFCAAAPCTISTLWSDERVFSAFGPDNSAEIMKRITEYALGLIKGESFSRPDLFLHEYFPQVKSQANRVCGFVPADTFVLNALVGVDYALWSVYAQENGIKDFDGIIPEYAKKALSHRSERLARIPLVSYAVSGDSVRSLLDSGTALMKIKIGHSAGKGMPRAEDMKTMLEWDKARLSEIHSIAKRYTTPLTKDGGVRYYLDANGRYDSPERLEALIDHADKIGALGRIELIEEPFAAENRFDVSALPVVINADESAHSLADVKERIALGYRAAALKPIAKTMSVSFEMAAAVDEAGGEALCADLTVVPLLAEWNKQFAARIAPLHGMNCGVIEINGDQNYKNWAEMGALLPEGLAFDPTPGGCIETPDSFYSDSGVLFCKNGYTEMFI